MRLMQSFFSLRHKHSTARNEPNIPLQPLSDDSVVDVAVLTINVGKQGSLHKQIHMRVICQKACDEARVETDADLDAVVMQTVAKWVGHGGRCIVLSDLDDLQASMSDPIKPTPQTLKASLATFQVSLLL